MQEEFFPKNAAELYSSTEWMGKVRSIVRTFNVSDPVEDSVHDVIVLMLERERQGKPYLALWDPAKGAFSTYLFRFVINLMCKKHTREHRTQLGPLLRQAYRFSNTPDVSGEISEEHIAGASQRDPLIEKQAIRLGRKYGTKTTVEYRACGYVVKRADGHVEEHKIDVPEYLVGRKFARSAETITALLLQDLTVSEVAQVLQVSTTFIYKTLSNLTADERMLALVS